VGEDRRIAAVTGSRRGIGYAIAEELAKEGYHVVLSGTVSEDKAEPLVKEFLKKGYSAEYIRCNISDTEERKGFINSIFSRYSRLDVLVNNAGTTPPKRMDVLETTEDSFDFVLDVNLKGTFFMCQLAANQMIRAKQFLIDYKPRIINISSISAYTSSTNRGEYCISKAGISMITKLFADRLAEYGIPVFEIRPGIIMTDMTAAVSEKYQKLIDEGLTPIKRLGLPKDVADCVMAVVSGRLDFATGQVIDADGGFHIRRL